MKLNHSMILMNSAGEGAMAAGGGDPAPAADPTPAAGLAPAADPVSGSALTGGAPASVADPAPAVSASDFDFSLRDGWLAALPEEIREDATLKNVTDIKSMADQLVKAQRMVGANKVAIPGKHSTEGDHKDFWIKMGMPETFEKYEVKLPEEASFDDGFISKFKDHAFNNGMLPAQAEKLLDAYNGWNTEALATQATAIKEKTDAGIAQLKQQYGEAFNAKISAVRAAVKETGAAPGNEELFTWLDNTEIEGVKATDHPAMIRIFEFMSGLMSEDTILPGSSEGANTPKELEKLANDIIADKEHPYNNAKHPNHKAAVQEVQGYFERMYPAAQ